MTAYPCTGVVCPPLNYPAGNPAAQNHPGQQNWPTTYCPPTSIYHTCANGCAGSPALEQGAQAPAALTGYPHGTQSLGYACTSVAPCTHGVGAAQPAAPAQNTHYLYCMSAAYHCAANAGAVAPAALTGYPHGTQSLGYACTSVAPCTHGVGATQPAAPVQNTHYLYCNSTVYHCPAGAGQAAVSAFCGPTYSGPCAAGAGAAAPANAVPNAGQAPMYSGPYCSAAYTCPPCGTEVPQQAQENIALGTYHITYATACYRCAPVAAHATQQYTAGACLSYGCTTYAVPCAAGAAAAPQQAQPYAMPNLPLTLNCAYTHPVTSCSPHCRHDLPQQAQANAAPAPYVSGACTITSPITHCQCLPATPPVNYTALNCPTVYPSLCLPGCR